MAEKTAYVTSKAERWTYGIYFFGQLLLYMLVSSFYQLFLTDAGISATVVGGVFMLAKIWDAVNDPLFGVIVDKTNRKGGKYKPWVKLSTIVIPLTTLFMFCTPASASLQVKTLWAAGAYVLWDTAYTMCDVPIFALATAMTPHLHERDRLYSINRFFCMLGGLAVVVLAPMLYPNIGWPATAAIICAMALATMLPIGYTSKERVAGDADKSPSIGELLRYLLKNKYLLVFNGAAILYALTNTASAVQNYFAINNLGSADWITILALLVSLPMLAVALLVPRLLGRVDKFRVYLAAFGVSIVTSIVMYFAGYSNLVLFCMLAVLRSCAGSFSGVVLVMITADCAEYGHYKTGERAQGVAFSIQTFTAKITGALSSAIGMLVLGYVGFVSGEGVVQTAKTLKGIWFLYSGFPAVAGVAAFLVLLLFYKLNDRDVQIMAKCNQGELTREEAQTQLSRSY